MLQWSFLLMSFAAYILAFSWVHKGAMSVLDIRAILDITNSPEMIICTYAFIVFLLRI